MKNLFLMHIRQRKVIIHIHMAMYVFTFSMVIFYLHFTHALQLRQIRVDFVNQVHFQILDSALERRMQQCCFSDRCVICLTDRLWGAQWDLRCMISSHCHIVASASPPWMVWRMTSRLAHTSCLGRMNLIIYYAEHQHPTTGGLTLV